MSLSTLFLAPVTRTSPASRAPPTIRNASTALRIGRPGGPRYQRVGAGRVAVGGRRIAAG